MGLSGVVVAVDVAVDVDAVDERGEVGGTVIVREGLGVGSALWVAAAQLLVVMVAVLLLLCEVGVEDGGVGGRALEAKRSKSAVGCC
jgi:hypothetical protein